MGKFVFLNRISFNIESVNIVAIEDDKYTNIAMYLDRSKHILYSEKIDGFSGYEDIKAIELRKLFYDCVIMNANLGYARGEIGHGGIDYKAHENKLEDIIEEFKLFFANNTEYLELREELNNTRDFSKLDAIRDKVDNMSSHKLKLTEEKIKSLFS